MDYLVAMKTAIIQSLTKDFESHAKQTENGVEFWLARELARHLVLDHFADAGRIVTLRLR